MPRSSNDSQQYKDMDRNRKIWQEYVFGYTQAQIAIRFGLTQQAVSIIIKKMRDELKPKTREEETEDMVQRLREYRAELLAVMRREHVVVSNGRVVRDGKETVLDDGPVMEAIKTLLQVDGRLARLLGLDAPTKIAADINLPADPVEAELREIINEQRALNALRAGRRTKPTGRGR